MPKREVCDSNKTCFWNNFVLGIDLEEKLALFNLFPHSFILEKESNFLPAVAACEWSSGVLGQIGGTPAEMQRNKLKTIKKKNSRIKIREEKITFCSPDFLLFFFLPFVLKSPRDLSRYQGKSSLNSLGVKLIKIDLKWQRRWHLPADRRRVLPATGFSSSQFWKTILLWTFSDFPKFKNCETLIRII